MADEGAERKVRKEREPITFACSIILLLACIAVTASYVHQEYIVGTPDTVVTEKSTVSVDYTLSFYNYYSEDGCVVFQTTMSDVNDQKEKGAYVFSDDYTFNDSRLSVTMSKSDVLEGFKNALIGHKAGDTITVVIKASDGYTNPVEYGEIKLTDLKMKKTVTMTSADFNAKYGFTPTGAYTIPAEKTDYGCEAHVYETTEKMWVVEYDMEEDKTYDRTVDGMVTKYEVTGISGETVTYKLILPDGIKTNVIGDDGKPSETFVHDGKTYYATKMVKVTIDGDRSVYIVGYDDDGNYLYKYGAAQYQADLYFTIKIDSIS